MTINTVTRLVICVGLVVVLVASIGAQAGPAPVITSSVQAGKKQQLAGSGSESAEGHQLKASNGQQENLITTEEELSGPTSASQTKSPQQQQQQQPASSSSSGQPGLNSNHQKSTVRSLNAEKLRRGLTNFMNHLNPAPFFVPPSPLPGSGVKSMANNNNNNNKNVGSQAEPATIITDGPTADAVIKGPNRLVQARPLGGPLRWGRR